jgi:hypothetical protein
VEEAQCSSGAGRRELLRGVFAKVALARTGTMAHSARQHWRARAVGRGDGELQTWWWHRLKQGNGDFWTDCSGKRKMKSEAVRAGFFPRVEYKNLENSPNLPLVTYLASSD